MNLINQFINRINPPYKIEDNPEIKIYNPKITLIDKDEYRYKIITRKNDKIDFDQIHEDCEELTEILKTLEPYVDVFKRRRYDFELYDHRNKNYHGFVDNKLKKLSVNMKCISMAIHELGHIIDKGHSTNTEFSPLIEIYKKTNEDMKNEKIINYSEISSNYEQYILKNREIFARLFQQYYLTNFNVSERFQKIEIDIGEEIAMKMYEQHRTEIEEYFDKEFIKIYEKTDRYHVQLSEDLLEFEQNQSYELF